MNIPQGWQIVPIEATPEMVQAAEDRHVEGASYIAENSIQFALWREVWRAMLAAAPQQNAAGQERQPSDQRRVNPVRSHQGGTTPATAAERCTLKRGEEQCPNTAAGGLRVNIYAAPTIQKRYGRRVMLSLIFDLPMCLACMPKLTPDNLMTDEQWRAFARVAQQRNSGILADRAQTEIVLCQFEDPEYVALRAQIAKQAAANDSQPGPSGPTT